eukprot:scaffold764_cov248-Pinguiococcus_pyrenoidosus.AAC.27
MGAAAARSKVSRRTSEAQSPGATQGIRSCTAALASPNGELLIKEKSRGVKPLSKRSSAVAPVSSRA